MTTMQEPERDDFLRYSEALDEIWRLRRILAHEACVMEAHLTLKTFPKSRRGHAEAQVERMRASARGGSKDVQYNLDPRALNYAMGLAGAQSTLTAAQFQAEPQRCAPVIPIASAGGTS